MTPSGLNTNSTQVFTFEADMNVKIEGPSMVSLIRHCLRYHQIPSLKDHENVPGETLLAAISFAILPYARALVLLLRASLSTLRRTDSDVPDGEFSSFLEDEEVMYIEDGFYFVEKLGCPMPSEIMKPCPKRDGDEPSTWIDTIIHWIDGVVTLDAFHGSRGNHMKFNSELKSWSKVSVPRNDMKFFHENIKV